MSPRKRGGRKGGRGQRKGPAKDVELFEGRVGEMYGLEAMLRVPGEPLPLRALLRKAIARKPGVVVGDVVLFAALDRGAEDEVDAPRAVINQVTPRTNVLTRPDLHGHPRAIAANLDHVVAVVTPASPPLRMGLVDRYLAASLAADIAPVICLNKMDLPEAEDALAQLAVYREMGIPVIPTSATEESGLEALRAHLEGKRSVLVGHSGVGKSSLSCALIPGLERKVGEVNENIGRGRHTTTSSRLLDLPGDGTLVDTPGIRSFGLVGISSRELSQFYPDFMPFVPECRFRGCTHLHEPGCRVRAALEEGLVDAGRYERYAQIYASIKEEEEQNAF